MRGILNGIFLNRIMSVWSSMAPDGSIHENVRVLDRPRPRLGSVLKFNGPVLLILENRQFEGKLLSYELDPDGCYIVIQTDSPSV
jgi:hypothetical protein